MKVTVEKPLLIEIASWNYKFQFYAINYVIYEDLALPLLFGGNHFNRWLFSRNLSNQKHEINMVQGNEVWYKSVLLNPPITNLLSTDQPTTDHLPIEP